jgi:methanogenic corrinoid protein MtbC1
MMVTNLEGSLIPEYPPEFGEYRARLIAGLLSVDRLAVKEILTRASTAHYPYQFVEGLVVPALEQIGTGWEAGEYSLSQVYMAGRLCEEAVDLLLPATHQARLTQPKMAIAVLEDHHLLGKRIVYSVLRASGFALANYGRMGVDELANRVVEVEIKILLISVFMLPSALRVKDLRASLDRAASPVKIVVGGAPFRFDPELWREVGADAFGTTANEAVDILRQLIEKIA